MTVMALVLAFLPDPAAALAEMVRVTRPGGWVASYMWDLPQGLPIYPLLHAMKELGLPVKPTPSPRIAARAPMLALWQGAGLRDVAGTALPLALRFADFPAYWQWVTSPSGPHAKSIAALDDAMQTRLKARLDASLPRDATGAIAYTALAQAVRGRKPG